MELQTEADSTEKSVFFEKQTEADGDDIGDNPHDDEPVPYVCVVCHKPFRTKENLVQHRRLRTGEVWYSCSHCEKGFSCPSSLYYHTNAHASKYKCAECGKCCISSYKLTRHMRRHSGEKPFECTVCSKRFVAADTLAGHMRIHSEWKPEACMKQIEAGGIDVSERLYDDKQRPHVCTVCNKRFTTTGSLNRHRATHTGENWYSCSYCGKSYSYKCNLDGHMNIHIGKYKCTECGLCCASNKHLEIHMRRHSREELCKPFLCTVCGKQFSVLQYLVEHSRVHRGEKPYYICHVCSKEFIHFKNLDDHLKIHTRDKPYKCTFCDKSFHTSSDLQKHKRHVHCSRRPYECTVCGKAFKTSVNLRCHVSSIHTDAKPYSCRHCSDCFVCIDQLKRHLLKSHNEGTWFMCDICQKKFITVHELKKHSLKHEAVKPYVCSECPKCFCTAAELTQHYPVHLHIDQPMNGVFDFSAVLCSLHHLLHFWRSYVFTHVFLSVSNITHKVMDRFSLNLHIGNGNRPRKS